MRWQSLVPRPDAKSDYIKSQKNEAVNSVSGPPDFVLFASQVLCLTPEEIRLAKRNSDDTSAIRSLELSLYRMLFGVDANVTSTLQEQYMQTSQVLHAMGYKRPWHTSSVERLLALMFASIVRLRWREVSGTSLCKFIIYLLNNPTPKLTTLVTV